MSSPEQELFAAARAYVRAVCGSSNRPVIVLITLDDGRPLLLPLPVHQPPPPPPSPRDDERNCQTDILAVLRGCGGRMTAGQILSELERRDWIHGERTVTGHLADMVAAGIIVNATRTRPRGYSLPAASAPQ